MAGYLQHKKKTFFLEKAIISSYFLIFPKFKVFCFFLPQKPRNYMEKLFLENNTIWD